MTGAGALLGRVRAHAEHVHQVLEALTAARHSAEDREHGITVCTDGWGLIDRVRLDPAALTTDPARLGEAVVAAAQRAAARADQDRTELSAPLLGAGEEDRGT